MKTSTFKSLRIAAASFICVTAAVVSLTACDLATDMGAYADLYANYLYVKNWGVSLTSKVASTYNGGNTITIDPSSTENFVVDLELDNPKEVDYIAEVEIVEVAGGGGHLFTA